MSKPKQPRRRQRIVLVIRETGKPSVARTFYEVPSEKVMELATAAIQKTFPNSLVR